MAAVCFSAGLTIWLLCGACVLYVMSEKGKSIDDLDNIDKFGFVIAIFPIGIVLVFFLLLFWTLLQEDIRVTLKEIHEKPNQ